ncbi:C-type mannose receptor 2-like [Elysia marginata]|uniref:C-type mannose receptor 2-like n=1 Tax=Elysia marginata TaxID=1093978 RepID=A0AAV4JFV2_9GAST|nr:C-type mannose receptor 2-like [Elysia marginata]
MTVIPDPRCCDSYDAHSVSCIVDVDLSSIENVTSLTVYASQGDTDTDEFMRVAALELGKPEPLLFDSSEQHNASGNIGTGNDSISQLLFSWTSPLVVEVKRYMCEVKGVSTDGLEVLISANAELFSKELTVDTVGVERNTTGENQDMVANLSQGTPGHNVDNPDNDSVDVVPVTCNLDMVNRGHLNASTEAILHEMTDSTAKLERNIHTTNTDVQFLKQKVNMLEELANTRINSIADIQAQMSSFVEVYKTTYLLSNFDVLGLFRGNRYYVSKTEAYFDIWAAGTQCSRLDGYLVEIDDQAEFDFVVGKLRAVKATRFYTGANDLDQEGTFRFWNSNRPVVYENWSFLAPNNYEGVQHCVEMNPLDDYKFNDMFCQLLSKYICEGPK